MILDDRTATSVVNAEHFAGPVRDVAQAILWVDGQNNETNPTNQHNAGTICVRAGQRSPWRSNSLTTPGQTSRSARAPSILANPRNRSHSTGLRQIVQ